MKVRCIASREPDFQINGLYIFKEHKDGMGIEDDEEFVWTLMPENGNTLADFNLVHWENPGCLPVAKFEPWENQHDN